MARASYTLNVSPDVLGNMIDIYFDNMTAISLFHEPSFQDKLLSIESPAQTHALLAAVLAFSARFCAPESQDGYNSSMLAGMNHNPLYFLERASRFFEEALKECGDESPPLCVLQAQILIAHCQLTQGVRGMAWRALGTCVRLAYELNLHLVDVERPQHVVDPKQWCEDEEKRRAWWAIWEMDVFASTVRRYPTAVNWSQIETLLPVEDKYWFQGKPWASCFLELDPIRRWKVLQESGNQSAKAWFLVINSLMKEAQLISSPQAVSRLDRVDRRRYSAKPNKDRIHAATMADEARDKLETLENCVRCFVMALPNSLKYRNQYLGFEASQPGEISSSSRQRDCGLYNIHIMTQLSKLMIHHYGIFSESARTSRTAPKQYRDITSQSFASGGIKNDDSVAVYQYFEAADEILGIVNRSSEDHIQHINAFLASTIWLASAVQLVRKEFGPSETNISLVKSKFEVLNLTYKRHTIEGSER
ncbi:hypothetical protein D0Z07_8681 [Hyphodiscus hymeniophilus]|uniref:Xylanolytic transcriptional activator regulatory domain-containing protein n=1 Tax=Hyphodiscus hymeniophilus TaxID=353542 RepID=A0A9P6SLL2_9HELO|nr:hypothetical protein D0Z07_8681 [Hyphodiscus hymeniophilus]